MSVAGAKMALEGSLQGLGVRPALYRFAQQCHLTGNIVNSPTGVELDLEGEREQLRLFHSGITQILPPGAKLLESRFDWCPTQGFPELKIFSQNSGQNRMATPVLPDRATCGECLAELLSPGNRRYRYPFTTCANCGPRFTIYDRPPYDREHTEMRLFPMCDLCEKEFRDPTNRRFHAETISCSDCGPGVTAIESGDFQKGEAALAAAVQALRTGKVIAVLGVGGFHLMVDACNGDAVQLLRERKQRPEKSFAVMFQNVGALAEYAVISPQERASLESPENPIVLLPKRKGKELATAVGGESDFVGALLPGNPLYHLLAQDFGGPLVATSGNRSGEPLVYEADEGVASLGTLADLILVHNRPIRVPVDDSVIRWCGNQPLFLRTARGFSPLRFAIPKEWPSAVACGGHDKNTVSFLSDGWIETSQPFGNLSTKRARELSRRAVVNARQRIEGATLLHDLHPDYGSTVIARESVNKSGLRLMGIQHHCAHAFAVALENNCFDSFLGFIWDGFGWGNDGTLWGGEVLHFRNPSLQRVGSLRPFPIPGGERASRSPELCAKGIAMAQEKKSGKVPLTTSVGRLFDAVAFLVGFKGSCTYEGQAAQWLERQAEKVSEKAVPFRISLSESESTFDWEPMLAELILERDHGASSAALAARFHATLVAWIVQTAKRHQEKNIILAGGCFQNALLVREARSALSAAGFLPMNAKQLAPNDSSISVGQLVAFSLMHERSGPCA